MRLFEAKLANRPRVFILNRIPFHPFFNPEKVPIYDDISGGAVLDSLFSTDWLDYKNMRVEFAGTNAQLRTFINHYIAEWKGAPELSTVWSDEAVAKAVDVAKREFRMKDNSVHEAFKHSVVGEAKYAVPMPSNRQLNRIVGELLDLIGDDSDPEVRTPSKDPLTRIIHFNVSGEDVLNKLESKYGQPQKSFKFPEFRVPWKRWVVGDTFVLWKYYADARADVIIYPRNTIGDAAINRSRDRDTTRRLRDINEARYATHVKTADEAYNLYQRAFDNIKQDEHHSLKQFGVLFVDVIFDEHAQRDYAACYFMGHYITEDEARSGVESFMKKYGLPYNEIVIDQASETTQHITATFWDPISEAQHAPNRMIYSALFHFDFYHSNSPSGELMGEVIDGTFTSIERAKSVLSKRLLYGWQKVNYNDPEPTVKYDEWKSPQDGSQMWAVHLQPDRETARMKPYTVFVMKGGSRPTNEDLNPDVVRDIRESLNEARYHLEMSAERAWEVYKPLIGQEFEVSGIRLHVLGGISPGERTRMGAEGEGMMEFECWRDNLGRLHPDDAKKAVAQLLHKHKIPHTRIFAAATNEEITEVMVLVYYREKNRQ